MKTTLAWCSFAVATVLVFTGLMLPPKGIVDGSVLIAMAQFLVLCATFCGVEHYIDIIRKLPIKK